jgi:hypothetical protein
VTSADILHQQRRTSGRQGRIIMKKLLNTVSSTAGLSLIGLALLGAAV